MENQQERLTEIRFYLVIQKLYTEHPNVDDLCNLIEVLALFSPFNVLSIQDSMMKVLTVPEYKPIQQEIAVLLWAAQVPIRKIAEAAHYNHKRVYAAVDSYKQDPFPFRPIFTEARRSEMEKFFDALKKLSTFGGYVL